MPWNQKLEIASYLMKLMVLSTYQNIQGLDVNLNVQPGLLPIAANAYHGTTPIILPIGQCVTCLVEIVLTQ